ncbi:sorbosone dehydrogenase family protein [Phenylobacterium sp.]|uniref:PQQ-dependent sugar dehydrogenase n=1 Tax=Phenylobacterium sp. TaxID=1871053 RepID=UPI00273725C1|nr:sorbosone dehydrogenase family protein [Phenylobacterium sp.]MDP3854914.1 sorbosone dehydrogenase family protein [Phenylobacterium sp.]
MRPIVIAAGLAALALSACSQGSPEPFVGFGADPALPKPETGGLPTLNARKAVGWTATGQPTAPAGFTVTRFGSGLDHPRWLLVLPNGDVLVSEATTETKPAKGIQGMIANALQKKAGATGPSPNKIVLLRDADGDGVAEMKTDFATGLTRPFGMTLVGDTLYVANDNAVVKFPYAHGQISVAGAGEKVFDLPGGPINHHWTKNVIASPDGSKLYVTVGSNSNIGENGMENETNRAAVLEYALPAGQARVYASGLRNPNGLDWEPVTGALWTAVNERDMIGQDLVPDYMTSLKDGGFYGWPYSYYGQNVDARVKPPRPDLVAKAIAPDYALGPHTASLGLAFYKADAFPAAYKGGVFIGQHGSWNRTPPNGYRVVFIPFAGGKPSGPPQAFLSGFLDKKDQAQGRPVGVAVDKTGALLVADDVGDIVWRVAPVRPSTTIAR